MIALMVALSSFTDYAKNFIYSIFDSSPIRLSFAIIEKIP